jgi:hypothetical protein
MSKNSDKIKVIDKKASDNVYLHKDFHGSLCYAIKYVDEKFGHDATEEYLRRVGSTYFAPLSEKLKKDGLTALKEHFEKIFDLEQGEYEINISPDGSEMTLTITKCPAILHLLSKNMLFTDRHCETTRIVNQTICQNAGYTAECDYEPGKGKCVQRFRKEAK